MTPEDRPPLGGRDHGRALVRRGAIAIAALALAVLAALLVFTLTRSRAGRSTASASAHARPHSRPVALARSPAGLPLSKPAFTLKGLGSPARDRVHVGFGRPPQAGLLFNLATGQVLWQRNALKRARIASLTKMMSALLVVRSAPPNAPVLITRQAVDTPGSKVGILPLGRHVRLETMLYGLMLPSGNDAATALAEHVSGRVSRFVASMNVEAARLGMGCTRFSSPSGYVDQGNFSCTADLALLAHVDLAQPRIARVVRTSSAILPFPIKGGKLYLYNNNPLLIYHYPGITGLKTGYTLAAGKCLVATAERHGVRLGVVLLNSLNPANQARQLLDRAFQGVYHQRPVPEPAIPSEE